MIFLWMLIIENQSQHVYFSRFWNFNYEIVALSKASTGVPRLHKQIP